MDKSLVGAPNTSDTITGGRTLELSQYDRARQPHVAIVDGTTIKINTRTLSTELCCPICLDLLTTTMTTKECLHRFCSECITTALMRGNKECPTCRKKIISKRSLRPDPNFDFLISKIWPDRKVYEEMQEASMRLFQEQNSVEALQKSIEAGIKAQAATRRQRVQGSYEYEKRKRRPKQTDASAAPLSGEPWSESSSNGATLPNGSKHPAKEPSSPASGSDGSSDSDSSSDSTTSTSTSSTNSSSDAALSDTTAGDQSMASEQSAAPVVAAAGPSKANPKQVKAMGAPAVVGAKPPSSVSTLGDKMSKWLAERDPSSPLTQMEETSTRGQSTSSGLSSSFIKLLEEMRRKGEEIEVELVPARSLHRRAAQSKKDTPAALLTSRYIKGPPDVTMEHISGFLQQAMDAELMNSDPTARPEHFYILDHNNQLRRVLPHDTLFSAFIASTLGRALPAGGGAGKAEAAGPSPDAVTGADCPPQHLMLFFDVRPPEVDSADLLFEIISEEVGRRLGISAAASNAQPSTSSMGKQQAEPMEE